MAESAEVALAGLATTLPRLPVANGSALNITELEAKYAAERDKRLRADKGLQFADLSTTPEFAYLADDPWVDHTAMNKQTPVINDGDSVKFLVLGAGIGGLLFAVRLIQAGFKADEIKFVDIAGGFGGTWYWNRYPGLMCDTEAYIYLPLLEETGYIPKHKYSYGPEIRAHANRIAEKWQLTDKAMFRTKMKTADWDEEGKRWKVTMEVNRGLEEPKKSIVIHAQFIYAATGVLNFPQIPKLPGLERFKGHHFHTSRWDYGYTGGEPGETPTLDKLKDKRIALLGTGATAVQAVPQLAAWAKELIVFQRTPSAVDLRGQRLTNIAKWKDEVAFQAGWQNARMVSFAATVSADPSAVDIVSDGWGKLGTYYALVGGPSRGVLPPEEIPEYVTYFHVLDAERTNRVRARVDESVKDKTTANSLKSWYPTWCKRPTFHDDFLPAFNRPSVRLVDTDGKGVERITEHGLVVNGEEYPVDLLILSTGYRGPGEGDGSPAYRANMVVTGRAGKSMAEKWDGSIATLHGVVSHDFPNFFFPGPSQGAATANYTHLLDEMATHATYIIAEAAKMAKADKFYIEPSVEAEEAWTAQIVAGAGNFAGIVGCTPSYLTREGDVEQQRSLEQQMKAARGSIWPLGMVSFAETIKAWREKGGLEGIEVEV
ncbi:flavin-binding monooxygenase-like family protein [Mycena alexandri]|uniref:Flavin-binding monooxygenase-like family protein n=1 Tax=Mycena alexandri TaxID=1745969 RepID=A0AAD6T7W1_9AGAR|nr:flavin-binding monooxygenase-like family protein [Mycena alexandri]